jgi:hypothetical protein
LSCIVDAACGARGALDFLEIYKVIAHLNSTEAPPEYRSLIDFDVPVSLSGHSSGARAVLMAAALKDSPDTFLSSIDEVANMNVAMQYARDSVGSVVANHPDSMYAEKWNPDTSNYNITKTPVMILTGTKDYIEEDGSAWTDWNMMKSLKEKVYVNIVDAPHSEIIFRRRGMPFTIAFSKLYGCGDDTYFQALYEEGGLMDEEEVAGVGDRSSGDMGGYLGCWKDGTWPKGFGEYC